MRDWNRSSVDWEASRKAGGFVLLGQRLELPQTSIESQVYIDGGPKALRDLRREQKRNDHTA